MSDLRPSRGSRELRGLELADDRDSPGGRAAGRDTPEGPDTPDELGWAVGLETRTMGKGKRQHLSERLGERWDQEDTARAVDAASRAAFGETGGPIRLDNGDIAIIAAHPSVRDVFIIRPDGSVAPRKAVREVDDSLRISLRLVDDDAEQR